MKKLFLTSIATLYLTGSQFTYAQADRLSVVASVFPLYDFSREIAGDAADVRLLLPPGVDPHSWEPKPSDIVLLSKADIFLYISEGMEPWAGVFSRSVRKKDTVSVEILKSLRRSTSSVRDVTSDKGHRHAEDPHFWLDLDMAAQAVLVTADMFADSDIANRDLYLSNGRNYFEKLTALDGKFRTTLENCESKQLVTGGHAAFGHMARRYDLEQVSVYGLSPDAEPSPRHLSEIIETVRKNHIKTIFSEELMNPKMAQVLSEETGTRILVLNPAGNLTAQQWQKGAAFLDIMENNLITLREGLHCE